MLGCLFVCLDEARRRVWVKVQVPEIDRLTETMELTKRADSEARTAEGLHWSRPKEIGQVKEGERRLRNIGDNPKMAKGMGKRLGIGEMRASNALKRALGGYKLR